MKYARKFLTFRIRHGLTQRQLALALGLTIRAVKYIEAGNREPRISTLEKFDRLVENYRLERLNAGRLMSMRLR